MFWVIGSTGGTRPLHSAQWLCFASLLEEMEKKCCPWLWLASVSQNILLVSNLSPTGHVHTCTRVRTHARTHTHYYRRHWNPRIYFNPRHHTCLPEHWQRDHSLHFHRSASVCGFYIIGWVQEERPHMGSASITWYFRTSLDMMLPDPKGPLVKHYHS